MRPYDAMTVPSSFDGDMYAGVGLFGVVTEALNVAKGSRSPFALRVAPLGAGTIPNGEWCGVCIPGLLPERENRVEKLMVKVVFCCCWMIFREMAGGTVYDRYCECCRKLVRLAERAEN